MPKGDLTREEAFTWIKRNFKRLQKSGELPAVMTRYMKKYFDKPVEVFNPVDDKGQEMLEVFNGEAF